MNTRRSRPASKRAHLTPALAGALTVAATLITFAVVVVLECAAGSGHSHSVESLSGTAVCGVAVPVALIVGALFAVRISTLIGPAAADDVGAPRSRR